MDDTQNSIEEQSNRLDRLGARVEKSVSVSMAGAGYTRFVRLMRLALPLAAMAVVAIVFLRSGIEDHVIVTAEEIAPDFKANPILKNELLNPKFESRDKKNQPYEITAARAIQGAKNKELIMLEKPIGHVVMQDGAEVTMRSQTGAYRQDTERFFLQGDVYLEHVDGYSLRSEEAHIDLKDNYAWSDKDISGLGPDIAIQAKGVRADAKTGQILFTGPAKLVLQDEAVGLE